MSLTLLSCIILTAFLLYIPGTLFVRAFSFRWVDAFCFAPVASIFLYSIEEMVFVKLGLKCSTILLFVIALATSFFAFCLFTARCKKSSALSVEGAKCDAKDSSCFEFWAVVLYLVIACVAVYLFFIKRLDGPDSFFQGWDNTYHLTAIRGFINSGAWNPLASGRYTSLDISPSTSAPAGYYPSAFHALCAMTASGLNVEPMVSLNAVNTIVIALVFPLGFYRLLSIVSNNNRFVVIMGSLMSLGTAVSPWDMLTYGPLFPNLFAMAFVPITMSLFIMFCRSISLGKATIIISRLTILLMAAIVVFLGHPNGIFILIVLLLPFLCNWIWTELKSRGFQYKTLLLAEIGLISFTILFWFICFKHPLFSGQVSVTWPPISSLRCAITDNVLLSMVGRPANYVVAAFTVLGLFVLLKFSQVKWLLLSYLLASALYIVSAGTEGFVKQFLTGFWYTDYHRLAVVSAFMSSIIASFGAGFLLKKAYELVCNCISNKKIATYSKQITYILVVLLYGLLGYVTYKGDTHLWGDAVISSPFVYQLNEIANQYNKELIYYDVLTNEELEFVKSAESRISAEGLIVNSPNDGSMWLYAAEDLPVYYRDGYAPRQSVETKESMLIRTRLYEYTSSEEVQNAVRATGAKYVLQLDNGTRDNEFRIHYATYNPDDWQGIEKVAEDTPGFTLLAKQNDMRLYQIG